MIGTGFDSDLLKFHCNNICINKMMRVNFRERFPYFHVSWRRKMKFYWYGICCIEIQPVMGDTHQPVNLDTLTGPSGK
jgi:hypothetical protein